MQSDRITYGCGLGWVIVMPDAGVSLQDFVTTSRLRSTATIELDTGEVYHDVAVSEDAMKYLRYPTNNKSRGSRVIWVRADWYNQIVVIATLLIDKGGNTIANEQGESGFIQRDDYGSVGFVTDYTKKRFNITAISEDKSQASVNINATNTAKNSLVQINAGGSVVVNATSTIQTTSNDEVVLVVERPTEKSEKLVVRYKLNAGLSYKDEWTNTVAINSTGFVYSTKTNCKFILDETNNVATLSNKESKLDINGTVIKLSNPKNNLEINDTSLSFNNGSNVLEVSDNGISIGSKNISSESAILGNKLVSLLSDLLDALTRLTVITETLGVPSAPPTNLAEFIVLKGRLSTLLSKVVTLE